MANVTGGEGVCLAIVGVAPSIVAERCDGAQPAATVTELGKTCVYLAADATFTTGVDHIQSGGAEIGYGMK